MKNLFFVLILGLFLSGCRHADTYPDIPALEFKDLKFGDDGVLMTFTIINTFTDGDGDVGYYLDRPNSPEFDDSLSDYYYNYVINMQVQRSGAWVDTTIIFEAIDFNSDTTEADNDTTFVNYNDLISARIPYLTPEGQNKGLKGDIEKTAWLPFSMQDTIRFRVFIYDRNKHQSNIIFTPGYFVDTQ